MDSFTFEADADLPPGIFALEADGALVEPVMVDADVTLDLSAFALPDMPMMEAGSVHVVLTGGAISYHLDLSSYIA